MKLIPFPSENNGRLLQKVAYWVLVGMAIVSPLGQLTRFGQFTGEGDGQAMGAVTILTILYIGLSIINGSIMAAIKKTPRRPAPLLLRRMELPGNPGAGASGHVRGIPGRPHGQLLSGHACRLRKLLLRASIAIVALTFCFFMSICCVISLADYFEYINLEQVNVVENAFKTDDMRNLRVDSLTGPFSSRTIFANHMAITVTIAVWYVLLKGKSIIGLSAGVEMLGIFAISAVMSQSRGLYMAIPVAVLYMVYKQRSFLRLMPKLLLASVIFIAAATVVLLNHPDLMFAFVERLKGLLPSEFAYSSSGRFSIWSNLFKELMSNPQGIGFKDVYVANWGVIDTHNVYLKNLKQAGIIGIVMLTIAFIPLFKVLFRREMAPTESAIQSAIVCLGIYGLTHTVDSTLFLWVFIGFALSHYFRPVNPMQMQPNPQPQFHPHPHWPAPPHRPQRAPFPPTGPAR